MKYLIPYYGYYVLYRYGFEPGALSTPLLVALAAWHMVGAGVSVALILEWLLLASAR